MATALLRRSSIIYNACRFKFPASWCLSELLTPHFPIKNGIRRVSNGVSFYSQVATGVGLPSFMRGAVLWESGKPLSMEEFHIPRPKAGESLVRTKGCGVCHSDLHIIKGFQLDLESLVPSFFLVATVLTVQSRAKGTLYDGETRLLLRSSGKPVYMYSMAGLAEYCVVPANALTLLPDSLPYTESAILGCAVFTAYGAMAHAAEVRPGDSVAVIGTGGVVSSCLQIARAFGASEIIAVDVLDEKLEKAKTFGATHTVNAAREDPVGKIIEITGGKGVDVAVEALGKPQTFSQCTQSVKDGGKAVIIGLVQAGAVGQVDINRLVRRKIKVIGSHGGRARQDLPKLVRLAETGILNLSNTVSRRYNFEEAGKAFEDLNMGKIVRRAVIEIR